MEIKYTIEILTKDIQDIEKLVGNIGNSKDASDIDLDLALSKLRNVYEILTLIKADRLKELISSPPEQEKQAKESAPLESPGTDAEAISRPAPELHDEAETEVPDGADKEMGTGKKAPTEPETKAESEAEPEIEPESKPEPEPEIKSESAPDSSTEQEAEASAILAEKFSAEESINENLAEKLGSETESKMLGQSIDNISRNIGINDRFLIIRELFEGEAERFTNLLNELDNAGSYEAARNILQQELSDHMDHEGVEILNGLLKRRYIR